MRRIIFDVPRWSCFLHREARGLDSVDVADPPARRLEDEVFETLYAGELEALPEAERDPVLAPWADKLHAACNELPDFTRLGADCRGDALAAGTAVETIMAALKPQMDDLAAKGESPEIRRLLRSSCSKAAAAVEEQREALDGLAGVGFSGEAGTPGVRDGGPTRALAQRLRNDPRLRKIGLLAGRFRRIAAAKHRQRVRHGADEINDIEQGADLGRLLPVELAKLVFPRLRLVAFRDFLERQSMQYALKGTDTLGKGPLVVCLDKSGSMEGDEDIWATAVCLSLLELAQRERRPFAVLGFNAAVIFEAVVKDGAALPAEALFVSCSGGTSIHGVLTRALAIIADIGAGLSKADVVLITDGASDADHAGQVRARAAELDAAVLGIGIGVEPEALRPWCDKVEVVSDLADISTPTASALFE